MICDCDERIGIEINSWKQFEDLKKFFESQVKKGIFVEIEVKKPLYVGHTFYGKKIKWYADKWYQCVVCGTIWEFEYPDFPATGSVRKLNPEDYSEIK